MKKTIKKAQKGGKVPNGPLIKKKGEFKGSTLRNGGIRKAQSGDKLIRDSSGNYIYTKEVNRPEGKRYYQGSSSDISTAMKMASSKSRTNPSDSVRTTVQKKGSTLKRGGKIKGNGKNKKG